MSSVPRWSARLLLAAISLGTAPCVRAGDFEYWPKAVAYIPIREQWQFALEQRLTFDDGARRLGDYQTDFVVTYAGLADWLSVGLGYKATFEKDDDRWLLENRPYLNVTLKTTLYGFGLSSRSRFEYRHPEDDDETWRYRNKLTVTAPFPLTAWKILPYVAEEIFINFDEEGFNQQRLYGGFFLPLHERVRLELFYLWKLNEQDDGWDTTHVFGSWVHFQF